MGRLSVTPVGAVLPALVILGLAGLVLGSPEVQAAGLVAVLLALIVAAALWRNSRSVALASARLNSMSNRRAGASVGADPAPPARGSAEPAVPSDAARKRERQRYSHQQTAPD
jgi:hypothetical protein